METNIENNDSIDITSLTGLVSNTTNLYTTTDASISNSSFVHQLTLQHQYEFLEDVLTALVPLKSIQLGNFTIDTFSLIPIINDIRDIGGYSNGERILLNQLRTWYNTHTKITENNIR
tara:strand:+ start:31 stop:384 length:354 start_codon:yes stop_codon:yes gene_type:complete